MTTFSFTDCCALLGIDPKTLRRWMFQSAITLQKHPSDARKKCLTADQLQHLAILHHRLLCERKDVSSPQQEISKSQQCCIPSSSHPLPSSHQEADVIKQQFASLETQLAALQCQIDQLRQQLSHIQPVRASQATDDPSSAQISSPSMQVLPQQDALTQKEIERSQKRTSVIPLIEYGAQGTYVILSPQEGQLPFLPDSPDWFAWLSTVSSFRFVGQLGRFTASCVKRSPSKSRWRAHRQIRNRSYNQRLGRTEHLTIATLEQVAAALQSHVN